MTQLCLENDLFSRKELELAISFVDDHDLLAKAHISILTIPDSWSASVLLTDPIKIVFCLIGKQEAARIDWPRSLSENAQSSKYQTPFRDCFDALIWLVGHEIRHIQLHHDKAEGLNLEADADDWAYCKLLQWQKLNGCLCQMTQEPAEGAVFR